MVNVKSRWIPTIKAAARAKISKATTSAAPD
jgi:hypothetical protein